MSKHLSTEIEKLKIRILALAGLVETQIHRAVKSLEDLDSETAQKIIDSDFEIDQAEVEIEEECLKILALHQPVAIDLRIIISALKINIDLERIGDLAVNIAERTLFLCDKPPINLSFDFAEIRRKSLSMLKDSLDSLMRLDADLAKKVRNSDDEVDQINRQMYLYIGAEGKKKPDQIDSLLSYLSVSRHLERVADYATNIAEDVIYLVEGIIVRHKPTFPEGHPKIKQ
ncbi:MAG: phosphate signaling complex protein PhoU [Candidatus Riflebacteria bacterium]|nr:phosphate signaling complex protein PhoU [Candidatus Riflebacteria bacterium]